MKRHTALQDLSRDHHYLLLHARELRWALEKDPRGQPLAQVLSAFLAWWQTAGLAHLREEEEILLPFYARYASEEQKQNDRRLHADHIWLRDHIEQLLQKHDPSRDAMLVARIRKRLYEHVRFEERILFEHLQTVAQEAALQDLARRLRAFRTQQYGDTVTRREERGNR